MSCRSRLPKVIRVGRAVYRRYPKQQSPNIITEKEERYIKLGLESLLASGLVDDQRKFIEALIKDFTPEDGAVQGLSGL